MLQITLINRSLFRLHFIRVSLGGSCVPLFKTCYLVIDIMGSGRATTTIRKPRNALGHAFPSSIFVIPSNNTARSSSKPIQLINGPTHPMKDLTMCMSLGRTISDFTFQDYTISSALQVYKVACLPALTCVKRNGSFPRECLDVN